MGDGSEMVRRSKGDDSEKARYALELTKVKTRNNERDKIYDSRYFGSGYADKTLFVVRSGLLELDMLPVIDKYYEEHKLPSMAVLLNGSDKFNGHYGYHYGYYHHYGNYYQGDEA